MDINRNNYESSFLLYLDRELNVAEREAVENFLNENADLQKEFNLLQKTIQRPSEYLFEPKESLYHREEKRRFIPVYWMRIAAAFVLILAGGWFMTTVLNHPKNIRSTGEQKVATLDLKKKNPEMSGGKLDLEKTDQTGQQTKKGMAVNGNPGKTIYPVKEQKQNRTKYQMKIDEDEQFRNRDNQNRAIHQVGNEQQNSPPEEAMVAVAKSNAALELQANGYQSGPIDPIPVHMATGAQTPALLVAVARQGQAPDNLGQPDLQTENAISVIALNDRNKAIAGFFKKLTKHAPVEETADNSKKLRVSVFQISY